MNLKYRADPPLDTSGVQALFGIYFCFLVCGSFFIEPTPSVSTEDIWRRLVVVWALASICFWALPVWYFNLATGYYPTLWLDTRSIRVGIVLLTLPGVITHFTIYSILRVALSNVQGPTETQDGTQNAAGSTETIPAQQQDAPTTAQLEEDRQLFMGVLANIERARSRSELSRRESDAREVLSSAILSYRRVLLRANRRGRSVKRKRRVQKELFTCAHEIENARRAHIACMAALDAYNNSPLSLLSGRTSAMFNLLITHPCVHRVQVPDKTLFTGCLWIDLKTIYIPFLGALYEIGDFRLVCDVQTGLFKVVCLRTTSTGQYAHPFSYATAPGICFGATAFQDLKTFLCRLDLPAFVDTVVKMMTQPSTATGQHWRKVR